MAAAFHSGQSFSGFRVSDQARVHAGNVYNFEIKTDRGYWEKTIWMMLRLICR